jgi:sporulation protein YlmC with PRC-barrel domain
MLKPTLAAAALAAIVITPAFAEQPMSKPNSDATQSQSQSSTLKGTMGHGRFVQNQSQSEWRGSKLIGATVYGSNDANLGDINDVLIADNGSIRAVVVGVGGFLGVGEKNVAIPFNALNISRKRSGTSIAKVTVSYTKSELKNAPKFSYFDASKSSETTGSSAHGTNNKKSDQTKKK